AAGTTLMRIGHRWVRIDPAGLRRARQMLDEQDASRSHVGAIERLRLLVGQTTDDADPVELRLAGDGDDGLDTDGVDDGTGTITPDAAWVRALLAGLPDERLDEAKESADFHGELRHYQRRGLAWMQ